MNGKNQRLDINKIEMAKSRTLNSRYTRAN